MMERFHVWGLEHWVVLLVTGVMAWAFVGIQKWEGGAEEVKRRLAHGLAAVLVFSVFADPVVEWWRWHGESESLAWRRVHENAWPVHFCDFAAIFCAIALVRRDERCAELGYYWGLTGTLQGLLTPALVFGFPSPEFWVFFAQHGGVPIAAIGLTYGMGMAPRKGSWWVAAKWGMVFLGFVGLVNAGLNRGANGVRANYGFVCDKPGSGSIMDWMGPWPWYLLSLVALGSLAFWLLSLPWRGFGQERMRRVPRQRGGGS